MELTAENKAHIDARLLMKVSCRIGDTLLQETPGFRERQDSTGANA